MGTFVQHVIINCLVIIFLSRSATTIYGPLSYPLYSGYGEGFSDNFLRIVPFELSHRSAYIRFYTYKNQANALVTIVNRNSSKTYFHVFFSNIYNMLSDRAPMWATCRTYNK